jgi:hypothetical protein
VAAISDDKEQSDRPPPQPPPGNDDMIDWANDICNAISTAPSDQMQNHCKPTIAKLAFDDDSEATSIPNAIHSTTDHIPIHYAQETHAEDLLVADDMHNYDYVYDPIIHAFQNSNTALRDQWQPNLNTIVEETIYDISVINDNVALKPTNISNGKKRRSRSDYIKRMEKQHQNRIQQAISRNGIYRVQIQSAQHDGGANRSVTANKDILLHFETIEDYAINGVKDGEPAIVCTGKGYIPWRANNGEMILVRCLYCPNASGTILSPSDINSQYSNRYGGWTMDTDYDSKIGNFRLIARDGINHLNFSAYSENNLWFHYLDQVKDTEYEHIGKQTKAIVKKDLRMFSGCPRGTITSLY